MDFGLLGGWRYWRDGWQDGTDLAVTSGVQTGQEVSKLKGTRKCWSVAASSDARDLLSGGRDMSPIL